MLNRSPSLTLALIEAGKIPIVVLVTTFIASSAISTLRSLANATPFHALAGCYQFGSDSPGIVNSFFILSKRWSSSKVSPPFHTCDICHPIGYNVGNQEKSDVLRLHQKLCHARIRSILDDALYDTDHSCLSTSIDTCLVTLILPWTIKELKLRTWKPCEVLNGPLLCRRTICLDPHLSDLTGFITELLRMAHKASRTDPVFHSLGRPRQLCEKFNVSQHIRPLMKKKYINKIGVESRWSCVAVRCPGSEVGFSTTSPP